MRKILYLFAFLLTCSLTSNAQLKVVADGDVGIGTSTPTRDLDVAGTVDIYNNIFVGKDVGASDAFVRIGHGRSVDGNAFFTLVGDASAYSGYGLRFIRLAATGESRIEHRGTAPMVFNAPDVGGTYSFKIGGASKVEFLGNACRPGIDGAINLGQLSNRWAAVYAVNGVIQTSDKRLKKNIEKLDYGIKEVMQLNPVYYDWKDENSLLGRKIGLIAQEVDRVIEEVVYDEELELIDDGLGGHSMQVKKSDRLGLNYSELIPVLINAIKDQQHMIEDLSAEVAKLKANSTTGTTIDATLQQETVEVVDASALKQNQPNPFDESTVIKYSVSKDVQTAQMVIMNTNGQILKTINLEPTSNGQINLKAHALASGTYSYQLIADGNVIDSKTMVIQK